MTHEPLIDLARRLADLVPGTQDRHVAFGHAGSDAIDGALKLVRAATGRWRVFSFFGAYHGNTYGALGLSSVSLNMRRGFGPEVPGVHHIPFPDTYRSTGRTLACEHLNLIPDIVVLGKALGSGMPISAIVADATLMQRWRPPGHVFSTAANPVCCAVASVTLDILAEEALAERANAMGKILTDGLAARAEQHPCIGEIRGRCLMVGVDLVTEQPFWLPRARTQVPVGLRVLPAQPSQLRWWVGGRGYLPKFGSRLPPCCRPLTRSTFWTSECRAASAASTPHSSGGASRHEPCTRLE